MTWDAVAALAEIVGAIAVVSTLVYLARQIAVQHRSADVEIHESLIGGFNEIASLLASAPDLARIFETGLLAPDDLNAEESARFAWTFRLFANQYLKLWQFHKQGAVSDSYFNSLILQGVWLAQSEGGRRWFENEVAGLEEFKADLMSMQLPDDFVVALNVSR